MVENVLMIDTKSRGSFFCLLRYLQCYSFYFSAVFIYCALEYVLQRRLIMTKRLKIQEEEMKILITLIRCQIGRKAVEVMAKGAGKVAEEVLENQVDDRIIAEVLPGQVANNSIVGQNT